MEKVDIKKSINWIKSNKKINNKNNKKSIYKCIDKHHSPFLGDIIQYFFEIVYTFFEKCVRMTKVLKKR